MTGIKPYVGITIGMLALGGAAVGTTLGIGDRSTASDATRAGLLAGGVLAVFAGGAGAMKLMDAGHAPLAIALAGVAGIGLGMAMSSGELPGVPGQG